MKSSPKLLLLAALFLTFLLPRTSLGFTGAGQRGGGQTITCSSDNGRRNFCNADTSRGVRLSRQISGSPCTQGQTWGFDDRGIWVDRGCRAEFMVGGGGGNWGGGQGQTITCSSNNGNRNYCNIGGANPQNITLTRQISGSPCIRNQTWGVNQRGLWVDRGCRAEFSVGGGNWGGGGRPGNWQGQGQIVTCSSNDGRRNWCNIPNRGNVTLSRQISGSACIEGQTWGTDQRGLWVDRGCRAEFMVR
jgi:hypothetical protein